LKSPIVRLEQARNLAGKSPPPDSEFTKIAPATVVDLRINWEMLRIFWCCNDAAATACQSQAEIPETQSAFHRTQNEIVSVAPSVSQEDCAPAGIKAHSSPKL